MTTLPRWIHGQGVDDDREFLVRTVPPRCIVAIGGDTNLGLLAQLVLVNAFDEEFSVVAWLDPPPDNATHRAILEEAMASNELFTDESLD